MQRERGSWGTEQRPTDPVGGGDCYVYPRERPRARRAGLKRRGPRSRVVFPSSFPSLTAEDGSMGKKQDYPALPARVSGTRKKSSGTVCRSWEFPITTHHTPPCQFHDSPCLPSCFPVPWKRAKKEKKQVHRRVGLVIGFESPDLGYAAFEAVSACRTVPASMVQVADVPLRPHPMPCCRSPMHAAVNGSAVM